MPEITPVSRRVMRPELAANAAIAVAACLVLAGAGAARADPCTAPVIGYRAGQVIAGKIRYVGDGDSVCVGRKADASTWVEIRIADFHAPELNAPGGRRARRILAQMALGRRAICTVQRGRDGRTRSFDRVLATCVVGRKSLAERLRRAGAQEGGRGR